MPFNSHTTPERLEKARASVWTPDQWNFLVRRYALDRFGGQSTASQLHALLYPGANLNAMLRNREHVASTKTALDKTHHREGSSNVGKSNEGPFFGPFGGASIGSYPIVDQHHIYSAIRLAHHAPHSDRLLRAIHIAFDSVSES